MKPLPPLLCPSPVLLDHTFPRTDEELRRAAVALGTIEVCIRNDEAHLVVTHVFQEFYRGFDWQRTGQHSLLRDIYNHLGLWFLQGGRGVIMLHLEAQDCTPHPLPLGSGDGGLVDFWADEVGKLLASQLEASGDRFFVGVACDTAFAGQGLGSYENPRHVPTLPLVGPEELAALDPGYEWRIPGDITRQLVSFGEAKKNIHLLGGRVQDAKGTSHYQVKFRGHRTWTMSRNVDPVPDDFLRQLVEIAEYPFPVIKWVLLTGKPVPEPQLRLAGCMCRNDESCTQV